MLFYRLFSRLIPIIIILVLFSCKSKTGTSGKEESSPQSNEASPLSHVMKADPAMELALQEASLNGLSQSVESMIGEGVNVNAVDAENRTALMYASFNGHIEIVKALLNAGAEVGLRDAIGRTALLYASSGPFPETVKLLLENDADPNSRDADEQFTPIMHAAAEGQLEVVKILLEYGADPSLKDADGENAELFARQNGHNEVAELLKAK